MKTDEQTAPGTTEEIQHWLQLAEGLRLPLDTVTHELGIVAQKGAGKSYCASVLMEEMVGQGLFVGYIDPLGIAWGIRSSADGESAGLPVLILGGRHGDLPLDPAAGTIVSQFVLEQRQPFILDLSLFEDEEQQRQFVADFIEGFRPHEEVLLHLIVDESDIFAPQIPQSSAAQRSLRAMNQLTRRYRYKGIGVTLITQRPAELHKSVLGQIDLLIALRVVSPQDIKALDEWIKRNASEAERGQFLATLSGLETGRAWIWSPQWLRLFQQVAIRTRNTYDSSQTPKVGVKRSAPKQLAEIDLTHLNEQMAALIEQMRTQDPAWLRARIGELENQLRGARKEHALTGHTSAPDKDAADVQLIEAALPGNQEQVAALAAKDREIQELKTQLERLRNITLTIEGRRLTLGEAPSVLHLDSLSASVALATIDVEQLRSVSPRDAESEKHLPGEAPAPSLFERVQKLEAEKAQLQADLESLRNQQRSRRVASAPQQDVIEMLSNHERYTWKWLVQRLVNLGDTPAGISRELFSYDGRGLTTTELAGHLHRATNTVNRNIPVALIRSNLIDCQKRGNAYIYTGKIMDYLRAEFPGKEKALLAHIFVLLA
jgi:hypothetical protein